MREVEIKEYKSEGGFKPPEETGKWIGPYYFHEWGAYQGTTMAVIENPVDGQTMMVPPGQMRFVRKMWIQAGDEQCECGHLKKQHIYETGKCRPGFKCEMECEKFTEKE